MDIVLAMRSNLKSNCSDLLEITIMRLAFKAEDIASFQEITNILRNYNDDLVTSACLFSIGHFARMCESLKSDVITLLISEREKTQDKEIQEIIDRQLSLL
jgi:hypothetical protein